MTTNQITLLPFGLGLTTTNTSNLVRPLFTGTKAVDFYELLRKPVELSVEDMFAQLELSDPRAEAATEVGTKWVAQTFLSKHPTSLTTLRMRAGLSQTALGKLLNVTQPMVSKWEGCDINSLQLSTINNLATALSMTPIELIHALTSKGEELNNDH